MWRPWSGSVVESARGTVRDENHGEDVMKPRHAGSGHHLTKRQQAAILTVICYAEKKGLASPVADTVKILVLVYVDLLFMKLKHKYVHHEREDRLPPTESRE